MKGVSIYRLFMPFLDFDKHMASPRASDDPNEDAERLPDKLQSEMFTQTLVEINQSMGKMSKMLNVLWQKSEDKNMPPQQPVVEEPSSGPSGRGKKRTHESSSPTSSSNESDQNSRKRRRKSRKAHKPNRETPDYESDKVSVHAQDEDDNVSLLLNGSVKKDNPNSPDETLKSLGEMLEDVETTGDDITPRLAKIAENRWNKKLSAEKLKLIQEKYKRPDNCQTVCAMTVNPEIWAKLPLYQQRADLNVSKIQESVRKAALVSLQTAHSLTNTKSTELDIKQLLSQQVDSLALLGHIGHELACLRRYKIKSVLKPEYASICVDDGNSSKYLFGDDLPKRLKDAKETSNVGLAVNTSQSRRNNYRPRGNYQAKSYEGRSNWRQGHNSQNNSGYNDGSSRSGYFRRGKSNNFRKKGVKQQQTPQKQ